MLAAALSLGGSAAVSAADKVAITILNDNTDDVLVTVYDMNTRPHDKLLSRQRINGFASIPLSIAADAAGRGHVRWTAITATQSRQCGHKDRKGLADGDSVHVFAKSICPGT